MVALNTNPSSSVAGPESPKMASADSLATRREKAWPAVVCAMLAVASILLSTLYALFWQSSEKLTAAAAVPESIASWRWWATPQERNAFLHASNVLRDVNDVYFVSATRGWVAGSHGTLISTSDAGQTWTPAEYTGTADLRSIDFLDALTGWVAGANGTLLHTSDGGTHWILKPTRLGPKDFSQVLFASAQHGWLVTSGGELFVTNDGGASWAPTIVGSPGTLTSPNGSPVPRSLNPATKFNNKLPEPANQGSPAVEKTQAVSISAKAIAFTDDKNGWLLSASGAMLQTHNGGESWENVSRLASSGLVDFALPVANGGWAVGKDGTVMGFGVWSNIRPQLPYCSCTLRRVRFSDSENGWIVGDDGTMLVTNNGGRTWTKASGDAITGANLYGIASSGNTLVAIGAAGTVLASLDGGTTWARRTQGLQTHFRKVFVDERTNVIWVAGGDGTLVKSKDLGETWTIVSVGVTAKLRDVLMIDRGYGWAVGDVVARATHNGGVTWTAMEGIAPEILTRVQANDSGGVSVVSSEAKTRYLSSDFGQHWENVPWDVNFYATDALFLSDMKQGCVAGNSSEIRCTTDGGVSWLAAPVPVPAMARRLFVDTMQHWWAVGDGGMVVSFDPNAPEKTLRHVTPSMNDLMGVDFDGPRGVISGTNGTLLLTTDSGETWKTIDSGTTYTLQDIKLFGMKGVAVGDGTILTTGDGGRSWRPVVYSRLPAPWLYVAWVTILGVCLLLYRHLRGVPGALNDAEIPTIANHLSSDAPLAPDDYDALNLKEIALSLSAFLRNEETAPGITIAITGEWGMGKSSVMNLLRAELQKRKVCTAWFNAWHHQKEASMLAVLLETIRDQGTPRLWTPLLMFTFHLRLIVRRWYQHPVSSAVLLCTLVLAASIWLSDGMTVLDKVRELPETFSKVFEGQGRLLENLVSLDPQIGLLGAALLALLFLFNALRVVPQFLIAFPFSPARLLATMVGDFKPRDVEKQTTFRNEFARQFDSVTDALSPRWMVIFVDDLDRCVPEKALEVLESINYLVTSGKCFVVIGMARTQIERLIGLASEKLANEASDLMAHPKPSEDHDVDQEERAKRRAYARQYLEKLINVEIPVPRFDIQAWRRMVEPEIPAPAIKINYFDRLVYGIVRRRNGIVALVVASILIAGTLRFLAPMAISEAPRPTTSALIKPTIPTTPASSVPEIPRATSTTQIPTPISVPARDTDEPGPSFMLPGEKRVIWPWLLATIVVCAPIALAVRRLRANVRVRGFAYTLRDSDAFTASLLAWQPVIVALCMSPRGWKRFVNRTRYLAMRARVHRDDRLLPTDGLRALLGLKPRTASATMEIDNTQDEQARWTVAIAALQTISRYLPAVPDLVNCVLGASINSTDTEESALNRMLTFLPPDMRSGPTVEVREFIDRHDNPLEAALKAPELNVSVEWVAVLALLKIAVAQAQWQYWPPQHAFAQRLTQWITDLEGTPRA